MVVNFLDIKKRVGVSFILLDNGFVIFNSDGVGIIEVVGEGVSFECIG